MPEGINVRQNRVGVPKRVLMRALRASWVQEQRKARLRMEAQSMSRQKKKKNVIVALFRVGSLRLRNV